MDPNLLTMELVRSRLLDAESKHNRDDIGSGACEKSVAMYGEREFQCYYCKRFGHRKFECPRMLQAITHTNGQINTSKLNLIARQTWLMLTLCFWLTPIP